MIFHCVQQIVGILAWLHGLAAADGQAVGLRTHPCAVEQLCQKLGSSADELEGELLKVLHGGDGLNPWRSDGAREYFAPLLIIQLPQFQLR